MITDIQKQKDQLYQFDVLRGIAIIGVFLVHCQYAIYPDYDLSYGNYIVNFPERKEFYKLLTFSPFAFGGMGVTLFFIISGFLIHHITLKKGVENFTGALFFNKRFWRIYPPYLLALIFFACARFSFDDTAHDPLNLVSHLFLVHNFFSKYFFSIDGPFWSLAIEAQLYLLYPLFLLLRSLMGINRLMILLLVLSFLGTLYWWLVYNLDSIVFANSLLRYWFTWGLGALLAEYYHNKRQLLSKVPNYVVFLGVVLLVSSRIFIFHQITDLFLFSMLIAICVEKYLYRKRDISLLERLLIPLGLCSYTFYLIHSPYLRTMFDTIDLFNLSRVSTSLFWMVNILPVFLLIYALSYVGYIQIEQPSIKFGERFYKRFLTKKPF